MRLALAQIDTVVGDLDGNRERILARLEEARSAGTDLVLFPELCVTGYPPEDLLLRPAFVRAAEASLRQIAREVRGTVALVGCPLLENDLFNACAVIVDGEVKAVYRKRFLPNYGVFDEDRYFAPGRELLLLRHDDGLIGPTVCEDLWQPGPPATDLALAGALVITNISASPFHVGKNVEREEMLVTRARDSECFVALCNAVGAQDELVFDGHSVVCDIQPEVALARRLRDVRPRALARERNRLPEPEIVELGSAPARNGKPIEPLVAPHEEELEQMRLALEVGLSGYVDKNAFRDIVIGVSGGIDSALTAALAVEALGAERVHCVSMPSPFSSDETRADARKSTRLNSSHVRISYAVFC